MAEDRRCLRFVLNQNCSRAIVECGKVLATHHHDDRLLMFLPYLARFCGEPGSFSLMRQQCFRWGKTDRFIGWPRVVICNDD
jgi:hypothetical protein